jgi:hypothetical protein
MDWLGSDHVGTPTDTQVTIEELCFLCVVLLKVVQKHSEERGLLNTSQFGFNVCHSTTLQCMRLTDQVNLNFNSNLSTAAVSLDIEKAFDTTWHSGLLYMLSKLELDKANLDIGNIRCLNLAPVKHTTVHVTRLPSGATNDRA